MAGTGTLVPPHPELNFLWPPHPPGGRKGKRQRKRDTERVRREAQRETRNEDRDRGRHREAETHTHTETYHSPQKTHSRDFTGGPV